MHPVRQFILFRWALYLVVVLGIASFLLTRQHAVPTFKSDVAKRLAPKKVNLPDPSVIKTLDSAIAVLKGERVPFGGVDRVEPSLITLRQEVTATGQKKLPVHLSAIFLGPPKKYAIINGAVLEVGDKLADGRVLKDILSDAVLLGVGDVEERFEWLPSFRVELKKAKAEEVKAAAAAGAPEGTQTAPAPSTPQADLKNIPENPTPEQALNILQQLKKQQAKQ
jgi:hypothetical protein